MFEDKLNRILREYFEVYHGQRITPLVHKEDYATVHELDPSTGMPKKKIKKKRRHKS